MGILDVFSRFVREFLMFLEKNEIVKTFSRFSFGNFFGDYPDRFLDDFPGLL